MPDRYVREALLGSSAWQQLPDAETQLLFIRLLLVADDFGVYDGRAEVIANNTFPAACLSAEELDGIKRMIHALHVSGLIVRFSNKAKPYIAIWQWGNDLRGSRKFPAPPIDVDLEGLKVRGKFGKDIGWTNPPGFDPVSVLLDLDGRAVVPQPDEWRPESHMRPAPNAKVGWRREPQHVVTGSVAAPPPETGSVSQAASDRPLVTGMPVSRLQSSLQTPDAGAVAGAQTPPVTAHGNGVNGVEKIEFKDGAWSGVSDAQQLAWQQAFDGVAVPEQLDRMAAWLQAHPGERDAILHLGAGFEGFIVRWLLRETRTPRSMQG